MIAEDYCSYEVAKLLKDKGFNEDIHTVYEPTFNKFFNYPLKPNSYSNVIATPTHQMAMKWLREIYGIDIVIEVSDPSVKDRKYYCVIWKNYDSYILDLFGSYEEACESSIKYCLENLI